MDRWHADRTRLFACETQRRAFTGPKQGRYPLLESEMVEFVLEKEKRLYH